MGCSISKIYDDYEDYTKMCKQLQINPIELIERSGKKSFYDHKWEILKSLKVDTTYDFWKLVNDERNILKIFEKEVKKIQEGEK